MTERVIIVAARTSANASCWHASTMCLLTVQQHQQQGATGQSDDVISCDDRISSCSNTVEVVRNKKMLGRLACCLSVMACINCTLPHVQKQLLPFQASNIILLKPVCTSITSTTGTAGSCRFAYAKL
jgi:hypothetical protein